MKVLSDIDDNKTLLSDERKCYYRLICLVVHMEDYKMIGFHYERFSNDKITTRPCLSSSTYFITSVFYVLKKIG